jgi:hypothetical protein
LIPVKNQRVVSVRRSNTLAAGKPQDTILKAAFLDALVRRVERDSTGHIVTPTGTHSAKEIGRVLAAIERAR